jgi:hypothetical protein
MNYTISVSSCCRQAVATVTAFAFDKLVREPLAGITDLIAGVVNSFPPLCRAARDAVVDAVSARLTPAERQAVGHGMNRIESGLEMLAWPLSIIAGIALWRFPVLVWLFLLLAFVGLPV